MVPLSFDELYTVGKILNMNDTSDEAVIRKPTTVRYVQHQIPGKYR